MKLITIMHVEMEEVKKLSCALEAKTVNLDDLKDIPKTEEKKEGWRYVGCIVDRSAPGRVEGMGWHLPAVYVYWDVHMDALFRVDGEWYKSCPG